MSYCNDCDTITDCTDSSNPDCSCPLKLGSICVIYDGIDLVVINATQGDNLQEILIKIDNLFNDLINGGLFLNIGGGSEVYKQVNVLGQAELRTFTSVDNSITVTQLDETIDLSIATAAVAYTGSNIGGGQEVFNQVNVNDFEFRTLVAGSGMSITTVGDTIEIENTEVATAIIQQIERSADFALDDTMDEQVVFITGAANVNITVPTLISDDFKVGVVQLGTGVVTFVPTGTTVNNANGLVIDGQYNQAFIQKRNAGTEEFIALGNLTV